MSKTLIRWLTSQGKTPEAARQALSRLRSPVMRLRHLSLPDRQKFFYLQKQFYTERFWTALWVALVDSGSAYGRALNAVHMRGGIVPINHFGRFTGTPLNLQKQQNSQQVLDHLLRVGLLVKEAFPELGACVKISTGLPIPVLPLSVIKARLLAEEVLLAALEDWLRNNNFVSFGSARLRYDVKTPEFGKFEWDLTGPSYLSPFRKWEGGKLDPAFIAADVVLGAELTSQQIEFFMHKCASIANGKNRPLLPMLVASSFSHEAFKRGRGAGLVVTTPTNLFGKGVGDALSTLIDVLTNAVQVISKHPEVLGVLMDQLSKIRGAAQKLKGPLFELIVAYCAAEIDGKDTEVGIILPDGQGEVDVLAEKAKGRSVWVYECKGYSFDKYVPDMEVSKWLNQSIPRIFSWLNQRHRYVGAKVEFEFWTTGKFSPEALVLLDERQANTRKYGLSWKDGAAVYEYSKGLKSKSIRKTLKEHFLGPASDLRLKP